MFLALVSVHLSLVALVAAHPPKSVVERFQFAVKVVYATMFVMRATFGIQLLSHAISLLLAATVNHLQLYHYW
jgi:hypothetical protein